MNADTFLKAKLADHCINVCSHAGGQSVDNMLAIAFVLRNRVEAGWYGGDWMLNLCRANIEKKTTELIVDLKQGAIREFLRQVDDIYTGAAADELTNGALHYAELHLLKPDDWFSIHIVCGEENHPRLATVGLTSFFG